MLKSLTKKSKKSIILKLKIKNFLRYQLPIHIIVFATIALCSWIFDKWIEGVMFCIAHTCIRNSFDKQFHFNNIAYCLSLTLAIIWFAIPVTLPVAVSLLASIPIAFLICFFGFQVQDRVDLKKEVYKLNQYVAELLLQIGHKQIWSMTEDELYEHCRACGLDDIDCKIAYFIVIERLKGKDLYNAIGYSERQTKRKRKKILATIE